MESNRIETLFKQCRLRLNQIVVGTEILSYLVWIGGAGGLLLVILKWQGLSAVKFYFWLILVLAGGLVGFFIGWRCRLDQVSALNWLDEQLHNNQLFSATWSCVERNMAGAFDWSIWEQATNNLASISKVHWPYRRIIHWLAMAVILLISIPLLIETPVDSTELNPITEVTRKNEPPKKPGPKKDQIVQDPRMIAAQLFPNDPKLADQAEQALKNQDFQALERLLDDSRENIKQQLSQTGDVAKYQQLQQEQAKRDQVAKELQQRQISTDTSNKQHSNQESSKENNSELGGTKGPQTEKPGDRKRRAGQKNQQKDQSESSMNEDFQSNREDLPEGKGLVSNSGGTKAGKGQQVQQEGKPRKLRGSSGKQQINLGQKDDPEQEYLLPGKNPKTPMSQVLPNRQRLAEQELKKEAIPEEYVDFVRSYFLKLSKSDQTKEKINESGEQK